MKKSRAAKATEGLTTSERAYDRSNGMRPATIVEDPGKHQKAKLMTGSASLAGPANLGMVSIKSVHGAHLQAHTDGEIHASNPKRNEEETWFLIQIDESRGIYAFQNWRNGRYLSKKVPSPCVRADQTVIGRTEQWQLISGRPFGVVNAVVLQCIDDNSVIGANRPGDDSPCGGEVWAPTAATPVPDSSWPGWWVIEPATAPEPGRDAWNRIGDAVNDILNNITPADVAAVLSLL